VNAIRGDQATDELGPFVTGAGDSLMLMLTDFNAIAQLKIGRPVALAPGDEQ